MSFTAFEDDQIHWEIGQEFDDGSTILMVERMADRAPEIVQNEGIYLVAFATCFPCAWCCLCPFMCSAKKNMKAKVNNSALLVTDKSVVFYENDWVPSGFDNFHQILPKRNFTIHYDQLQDVRMEPQGSCQTCCCNNCLNPGPGIQFFPVGYVEYADGNTRDLLPPPTWQPYSLNEEELREKADKIRGYRNSYKKKERQLKDAGKGTRGTTGQVRSFCGSCGEKNESLKQFCGACGANTAF